MKKPLAGVTIPYYNMSNPSLSIFVSVYSSRNRRDFISSIDLTLSLFITDFLKLHDNIAHWDSIRNVNYSK